MKHVIHSEAGCVPVAGHFNVQEQICSAKGIFKYQPLVTAVGNAFKRANVKLHFKEDDVNKEKYSGIFPAGGYILKKDGRAIFLCSGY